MWFPATGQAQVTLHCVGAEFVGLSETGPAGPKGLAIDLLTKLARQSGFQCEVELLPWKRALALVESNQADILIAAYRTRDRAKDMHFLRRPFYLDRTLFYGLAQTPQAWNGNPASLASQSIGIVRGWSLGEHFEHFRNALNLVQVDSTEQALKLLQTGRITMLAGNERDFGELLGRREYASSIKPLLPPIQVAGTYFALANKWRNTPLAQRFDQAMSNAVASGLVGQLAKPYHLSFPEPNFNWNQFELDELGEFSE